MGRHSCTPQVMLTHTVPHTFLSDAKKRNAKRHSGKVEFQPSIESTPLQYKSGALL